MLIAHLILAGGRGSRMAGSAPETDKALIRLAGRPLVEHVLGRLEPQRGRIALSANGNPARFSHLAMPVLADPSDARSGTRPGPLAGILAGLNWASQLPDPPRGLLTVPTDTPFLPRDLAERLQAVAAANPGAVVIAAAADGLQQVCGLWPLSAARMIEQALAQGEHRVLAVAASQGMLAVPYLAKGPGGIDPFFNINEPSDLRIAERVLAGGSARMPVIGIAGWKNSGKTTLTERLIAELIRRGLAVVTVKHAHHGFDLDQPGTDSARHRAAGAQAVAIVSSKRWALMRELGAEPEPDLDAVLASLPPADIVLVEGYKLAAIPKIEVRRAAGRAGAPLQPGDTNVVAIAADHPITASVPVFGIDDVDGLATLLVERFSIPAPGSSSTQ